LQQNKEVVAVSGDGINDVPALRNADLGIAMGSGTEAAKESSKMVITDSNLRVIVDAVRSGRVIADNIRKVVYYLASTSLQEITVIAFSIFATLPLPFSPVHILWINLVTDGVQDKLFAFAKEEGNVMQRKPLRPDKLFFNASQIARILIFGLGMGLLTFFVYNHLLRHFPYEVATTIIFTSLCAAQWANGIQAQKEKEPFLKQIKNSFNINPWIFMGAGAGLILQLGAIYLVPAWFKTVPMTLSQWKYPLFFFLAGIILVEVRKWVEYAFVPSLKKVYKQL